MSGEPEYVQTVVVFELWIGPTRTHCTLPVDLPGRVWDRLLAGAPARISDVRIVTR